MAPRLFSFNNPHGACGTCDGLGVKQFFDEHKIIIDDELSLAAGAIRGWDKRTYYYFSQMQALAKRYAGIDWKIRGSDRDQSFDRRV